MENAQQMAIEILTMFEEFLSARNIIIDSQEREEYDAGEGTEKAIIFGNDYYSLEDEITDIILWSGKPSSSENSGP